VRILHLRDGLLPWAVWELIQNRGRHLTELSLDKAGQPDAGMRRIRTPPVKNTPVSYQGNLGVASGCNALLRSLDTNRVGDQYWNDLGQTHSSHNSNGSHEAWI
jgi:hypothetical protein